MSTLYRLKAYFGMVPAEDMDAYLDYEDEPDYYGEQRPGYPEQRRESRLDRATVERHRAPDWRQSEPASRVAPASTPAPAPSSHSATGRPPLVHGSLAVDSAPAEPPRLAVPSPAPSMAPEPAEPRRVPLSRITTVHPHSYNEARTIGERYRDGIPVIMNLTELDDAAAKRLVDFAAGLAFALRGSIDKVTSRVFLLSPAGVDVSAEDRRRLAEGGFFGQD